MPTNPEIKDYTEAEIVEACETRVNFDGFSGETCGSCHKKANVLAGGASWFCLCGHYNAQLIHGHQFPHEQPDYGPPRDRITQAYARAKKQ